MAMPETTISTKAQEPAVTVRWLGYAALATVLAAVVALCLALAGLLATATLDPNVGCPATDTGCQPSVKSEMGCGWLQAADSCDRQ